MIDLSQYTYRNILNSMLARVPDSFDKRDTSPIPTACGLSAYTLEEFYLLLDYVQSSAFIQTAVGSDLDELAVIGGLTRKEATPAVRLGTFDADVSLGARFATPTTESVVFVVTELVSDVDHTYKLTAETAGSIGNDYTGAILPINVTNVTSAEISTILVYGTDEETDEDLRARLLLALTDKPFAGNVAAYKDAIEALAGVGGAQIYPPDEAGDPIVASVVTSEEYVVPDPASGIVAEAQAAADATAPIGATVTVVAPTELQVDIAATLTLDPGATVETVKADVKAALEAYFLEVRKNWATNVSPSGYAYAANIYVAKVTAAILSVDGVGNVTNVTLNSLSEDITPTETAATQQVPIVDTVTLTEAT